MTSVYEKQEIWQKVGEKEVKVAEYRNQIHVFGEYAILWNEEKDWENALEFLKKLPKRREVSEPPTA